MKTAIVTLTLSLLTLGSIGAAAPTADDQKNIQGTWIVESATQDGNTFNGISVGEKVVFAKDQVSMRDKDGKEQQKGSFKLDSTKTPKVLVLVPAEQQPNASAGQLAYDLSGNTLKLAMSTPDKRPTEVSDKGQILITLKRDKAK